MDNKLTNSISKSECIICAKHILSVKLKIDRMNRSGKCTGDVKKKMNELQILKKIYENSCDPEILKNVFRKENEFREYIYETTGL
jgi:hypothetical protein